MCTIVHTAQANGISPNDNMSLSILYYTKEKNVIGYAVNDYTDKPLITMNISLSGVQEKR